MGLVREPSSEVIRKLVGENLVRTPRLTHGCIVGIGMY